MIGFALKMVAAFVIFSAVPHTYITSYTPALSGLHAESVKVFSPLVSAVKNIVSSNTDTPVAK